MRIMFDEAQAANRRNSLLMLGFVLLLAFAVAYVMTQLFELGTFGIIIAVIFAVVYPLVTYYASDSIVLAASGAKPADETQYRQFHNVVEALSIAAGIPKPRVYVVNDPSPNAFATGRDPNHAAIAATTGLLAMMNRQELEGVVAHELSHVRNFDVRFMTITVATIGLISIMADIMLRMFIFSGGRRDRGGNVPAPLMIIGLVLVILSPILAQLVHLAVSRQREYLADATGVELTRYPAGLASALAKIKTAGIPTKTATQATAPLYISEPFGKQIIGLFATHPPLEDRIKRLEAM